VLPIFVAIEQGKLSMNTGVEILLQRIKDCPDDFQYDVSTDRSTKWNQLLMEALRSDVITEEEKSALRSEVTEMGRARFTEKVMRVLAGADNEMVDLYEIVDNSAFSSMADAQKYQSEMLRRQLDAQRVTLKRAELNSISAQDKAKLVALLEQQVAEGKKKAKRR
jgi:hypothetical protein